MRDVNEGLMTLTRCGGWTMFFAVYKNITRRKSHSSVG